MNDDIKRYLKQYQELYGDTIPLIETELPAEQESIVKDESESYDRSLEPDINSITMNEFHQSIKDCQNCFLGSCRTNFVFGKGNENATILIVGEAPGHDEDLKGIPFVGKAGQLLDKILGAIDLSLDNVYITNIVKCRPPNNRDPQPDEIESCNDYLQKQITYIKPKIIIALGRIAGQTLLNTSDTLGKLRGRFHNYKGIDLMVTYHPSALLRNEAWKRPTWEDMKLVKQRYAELETGNV